jgi:hypothetical protein
VNRRSVRARPFARRARLLLSAATLAILAPGLPVAPARAATDFDAVACSLPHEQLLRVWRGTEPDRSGQILVVPQQPNFLGSNFPHSGPWDYLQDVPVFWYGPGYLKPHKPVQRPITIADMPATTAGLLGFDAFHAPDGTALPEVLAAAKDTPPKLIVTMVWDAGGRSVLDTWPRDWPVLKSLIPKGIWYDDATVGSSPSITPATHATMGTGAFPRETGQVDAEFRLGAGTTLTRAGQLGPTLLDSATLADVYDRAMGNEPIVGDLASVTWHLNMMSHGAMWNGGDRDLAVLRISEDTNEGAEGTAWNIKGKNEPYYRFPEYVNQLPGVETYTDALDREDGAADNRWRSNSIEQLANGWDTPARVPFQDRLYAEVIRREGFGADDVPDLLYINSKIIDHVGHLWSVNSPEMSDTLRWQDAGLKEFIATLNHEVGRGEWVLVLTADHGHQFDPAVSGAFQVTPSALLADLQDRFDDDGDSTSVIIGARTSQTFLNEAELRQSGHTVEEIADFMLHYTKAQASSDPASLTAAERDEEVFAAVFPASVFDHPLPCLDEAGG